MLLKFYGILIRFLIIALKFCMIYRWTTLINTVLYRFNKKGDNFHFIFVISLNITLHLIFYLWLSSSKNMFFKCMYSDSPDRHAQSDRNYTEYLPWIMRMRILFSAFDICTGTYLYLSFPFIYLFIYEFLVIILSETIVSNDSANAPTQSYCCVAWVHIFFYMYLPVSVTKFRRHLQQVMNVSMCVLVYK